MSQKIKGGGARKYGRNKIDCKIYKDSRRREVNKLRRLKKHIVRHPNDEPIKDIIATLRILTGAR